jgi:hypothetical protein
MYAYYEPSTAGSSFRSLEADDIAGICEIYPPSRRPATTSCENRHGFSSQCGADQADPDEGCSIAPTSVGRSSSSLATLLFATLLVALRRSRKALFRTGSHERRSVGG